LTFPYRASEKRTGKTSKNVENEIKRIKLLKTESENRPRNIKSLHGTHFEESEGHIATGANHSIADLRKNSQILSYPSLKNIFFNDILPISNTGNIQNEVFRMKTIFKTQIRTLKTHSPSNFY
jgi:hypothetical protein